MTSCASPTCGKLRTISFWRCIFCLSSSVRSATFFGGVKKAWKRRKLVPETQMARDRWSEALSTPLVWMSWYSCAERSSGCGSERVGNGWPSVTRMGSTGWAGGWGPSATGVPGVGSLATVAVVRLRFSDFGGGLLGVSLGVSGGGGAASSRARALVDRRGSDMMKLASERWWKNIGDGTGPRRVISRPGCWRMRLGFAFQTSPDLAPVLSYTASRPEGMVLRRLMHRKHHYTNSCTLQATSVIPFTPPAQLGMNQAYALRQAFS